MSARQIDEQGRLRHLLTLDGLPRDVLLRLLDRAQELHARALGGGARDLLAG
jgi:aspartate carbamoyltransferase catalytic subunit